MESAICSMPFSVLCMLRFVLEPVFIRNICGFSSIILLQTRQNAQAGCRSQSILVRHSFVLEQNPASNAVARQVFFTQYAAKFSEKTRVYAFEDRF